MKGIVRVAGREVVGKGGRKSVGGLGEEKGEDKEAGE